MDPSIKFPTAEEKLAREVLEYRDASAAERVRALFEVSALTEAILASSPSRERQLRLLEEEEEREHRAWRELIAKHVGRARENDSL